MEFKEARMFIGLGYIQVEMDLNAYIIAHPAEIVLESHRSSYGLKRESRNLI